LSRRLLVGAKMREMNFMGRMLRRARATPLPRGSTYARARRL
jgi:hypothetical protein